MSDDPSRFSADWREPFRRRKHVKRIKPIPMVLTLAGTVMILLVFAMAFRGLSASSVPATDTAPGQTRQTEPK